MVLQLINAALILANKDKKLSLVNKRLAVSNLLFFLLILFFLLPSLAFPPLFVLICASLAPFIAYDLYVIDYFDKKKDVDDFLRNYSIAMIVGAITITSGAGGSTSGNGGDITLEASQAILFD